MIKELFVCLENLSLSKSILKKVVYRNSGDPKARIVSRWRLLPRFRSDERDLGSLDSAYPYPSWLSYLSSDAPMMHHALL